MSKTITVYGIPNCDTVKKARAWLGEHGVAYQFHDFKKQGLPLDHVDRWIDAAGWEALLKPSVVKRPVVEWGPTITVGFDPDRWEQIAAG